MRNKFENPFELSDQDPLQDQDANQEGPELLKNHDRVVSATQEMKDLVIEYQNHGWEIDSQKENHTKLTKSFNSVMNPTLRMLGTTVTLEVNINVAK